MFQIEWFLNIFNKTMALWICLDGVIFMAFINMVSYQKIFQMFCENIDGIANEEYQMITEIFYMVSAGRYYVPFHINCHLLVLVFQNTIMLIGHQGDIS